MFFRIISSNGEFLYAFWNLTIENRICHIRYNLIFHQCDFYNVLPIVWVRKNLFHIDYILIWIFHCASTRALSNFLLYWISYHKYYTLVSIQDEVFHVFSNCHLIEIFYDKYCIHMVFLQCESFRGILNSMNHKKIFHNICICKIFHLYELFHVALSH